MAWVHCHNPEKCRMKFHVLQVWPIWGLSKRLDFGFFYKNPLCLEIGKALFLFFGS